MLASSSQNMILIEGAATYERILAAVSEVETEEAIRHIQDFLKIYPEFALAHNDLAVLFYQTGNSLKALAHHEKAHKLDPTNITYRKNLADFYYVELEWTGEAIHTYLDILKDNPFDTESLNSLGTISLQIGRKEQARQYFSRTLQLDATNQTARHAMNQLSPSEAVSYDHKPLLQENHTINRQQKPVEAPSVKITFQNAASANKTEPTKSSEELYHEAVTLANSGRETEAIRVLEVLLTENPRNARAHNDLGVLYHMKGDFNKSRIHHEKAAGLEPESEVFQKNLADLLYREFGELEESLAIYVKLFALNRYDIELLKAIAHICLEVGNTDDARFFLKQILSIKPWDQDAGEALRAIEATSPRTALR